MNIITKDFMYQETKKILQFLFNLPELESILIKGIVVSSMDDKVAISRSIDKCFHDMYSVLIFK
ncbi:hypothetical protein [Chengkuizengella marina]|uniref:hypothetical protein n=1 Tax=Chengkuizengella marina TaxID=2507566 RepID=UPI00191C3C2C|nr:hypothetical protein [Chengkuizengella marina]